MTGIIDVPAARRALDACRSALNVMQQEQPTGDHWRVVWVGMRALLRTVPKCLYDVDLEDRALDDAVRSEIASFFADMGKSQPDPAIYWKFIRKGANDLLHQFKFDSFQITRIMTRPPMTLSGADEGAKFSEEVARYTASAISSRASMTYSAVHHVEVHEYVMKSGPFEGQDQRDVAGLAIEWLQEQLDGIVERARKAQ